MNQDARIKRRLELTRMIREENRNNRMKVHARENVLYGKTLYEPADYDEYGCAINTTANSPEETGQMSSFGLRFLLAVFLFAIYFVCKTQGTSFAGITSEQIETAVAGEDPLSQS